MKEIEKNGLHAGERIDRIGFGGLELIQKPDEFCYGVDAVILADFAAGLYKGEPGLIVDLGSGTGVIPLIMSRRNPESRLLGVEIQRDSWDRACRNAELNQLTDRLSFINDDIKNAGLSWGRELKGQVDLITCNPPYFKGGGGIVNDREPKTIARHETSAGLRDFLLCASYLLKPRGELFMIHRPSRLADICCLGRENRLEPKDMRFVSPRREKAPNLLMIRMVKDGGSQLKVLDPMWVYDAPGVYSAEVRKAYR